MKLIYARELSITKNSLFLGFYFFCFIVEIIILPNSSAFESFKLTFVCLHEYLSITYLYVSLISIIFYFYLWIMLKIFLFLDCLVFYSQDMFTKIKFLSLVFRIRDVGRTFYSMLLFMYSSYIYFIIRPPVTVFFLFFFFYYLLVISVSG